MVTMMEEINNLRIGGMHCAACATRIERAVAKVDGVTTITVHLPTEKARVTFQENKTTLAEIIDTIHSVGFTASLLQDRSKEADKLKEQEIHSLQWNVFFAVLLTIPLAWAMFDHFQWATFMYIPPLFTNSFFQLTLTIPMQFVIGFPFYERAWKAVKHGSANMDVLVVLSTSAAFFYSHYVTITSLHHSEPVVLYYETCAFIITFILIGKLLEAKTKTKTTEAVKHLYHLQTKSAIVYKNGIETEVAVHELVPGDTIVLRPGEKVPIDGQVVKGTSMINESLLTGESTPIEKNIGDQVYAGTLNHHRLLHVEVTKKESETVLSHIIKIVEDAHTSKAPIQRIADHVVRVFVPIIILLAGLTYGLSYVLLDPGNFSAALEKSITVLIIACPCALGLATPTSIMVGSGHAARLGILFKEGQFLEFLGKCKTVIFDKTGTLTKGTPHVTDLYVDRLSQHAFLELVGAAEQNANHPLAKAIVKEAKKNIHSLPPASNVESIPGYGVKASVLGVSVLLANPRYIAQNNFPLPVKAKEIIQTLERAGKTVMIVYRNQSFAGIIAVADEVKQTAKQTVGQMKRMGLDVGMLTGDNHMTGKTVAHAIGIEHFQTEVTPQEKAEIIEDLKQRGEEVMMVGDGMNDAPALAVATVGVALGTGSDIAIESGDVTIIKGSIDRVLDAITISKKTMTNIKQNLVWAFLYNSLMIPFAMFGLLAPWLAGAAMAFSSLSVVLNALRLNSVLS